MFHNTLRLINTTNNSRIRILHESYRNYITRYSCNCNNNSYSTAEAEAVIENVANYTVEEVQIPKSNGYLAGKLWQAEPVVDSGNLKQYAPIICIHGWLDNCGSFDPLIPLILRPNMKILAIDHPGHGYSSHTMSTHYDLLVDAYYSLIKAIKYFNWKTVTLLGHSIGAICAYKFAALFPEYVDRYIALENLRPLSGSEPVILARKAADMLLKVDEILSKRLPPLSYSYEEVLERTYISRGQSINIEGCKILLKRGASRQPNGKYCFNHDPRVKANTTREKYSEAEGLELGSGIRCPVCVIKGEPGIDYEPHEKFMEVVDNLRKTSSLVEFHTVPGTHHFHLNNPELVAPIINKFLDV